MSVEEPAPKRRRLRKAPDPDVDMQAEETPQDEDIPIASLSSKNPESAEAGAPAVSAPTAESDDEDSSSDSDSESDTSSSSDESASSESSSEEAVDPALMEDIPEDKEKETEQQKKARHLRTLQTAQLRRNELMALLGDLPPDDLDSYLKNAFVLVKVGEDPEALALAEVVGAEPSTVYPCRHPEHPKEVKRLVFQLRCKRGVNEKFIKASSISSSAIEEKHLIQWSKVMHRCRIDPEIFLDTLTERSEQITRMKHIIYTDKTVDQILARKPKIEFDAQKQSKMAAQVQIGLTQMDISSIKDNPMAELASQHKQAQIELHKMEKKEYQAQEHWFETRRDLYGIKEINRMNVERQKRDDAHALKYALAHEDEEEKKRNPFERRACRPVSAWDTSLTFVEELEEMKRQRLAREAKAARRNAQTKAPDVTETPATVAPEEVAHPEQPEIQPTVQLNQQDLEMDSDDEAQATELTAEEREKQEEREENMELLKMYQELLKNAS